jgi:MFS family permease
VRIAPPQLMGRVSALRTITQRVGMLGGGPLAGWLIHLFGPSAAFVGSAVLFALSVGSLALVTVAPLRSAPGTGAVPAAEEDRADGRARRKALLARTWAETVDGLRIVRRHRVLGGLLLLVAGMNVGFAGPFTAGIPLLAAADGWGARGAGLLIGAFGIGAAVSGLGLLFLQQVPWAGLVQLVTLLLMGLAIAAIGVVPSLPVALAAALLLGLGSGVFGTVVYALLLSASPAAEVGRVMALLSLVLEGTAGLSFLVTGVVGTTLGAGTAFVLGGLVIVVTALTCATRSQLRLLQTDRVAARTRAEPDQEAPAESRDRRVAEHPAAVAR